MNVKYHQLLKLKITMSPFKKTDFLVDVPVNPELVCRANVTKRRAQVMTKYYNQFK